jgi:hypothetical protein
MRTAMKRSQHHDAIRKQAIRRGAAILIQAVMAPRPTRRPPKVEADSQYSGESEAERFQEAVAAGR